jgi:thiosulfate dehydrogenase
MNPVKKTIIILAFVSSGLVQADDFKKSDLERWEEQFDDVAKEGRRLFTSPELGSNGVVCAQCHPNGANTHPETYPKFQKQMGRVAMMWEMVNWCIENPLEGMPLDADDPEMIAIHAYVARERKGVPLDPGRH